MVKTSVPAIADVIVDPSPELGLLEMEVCGMVELIIEGKTMYVVGVVVDPVLELGLWGLPTELDAEPKPGGSCPADNGAKYAVSASKPGILGV